MAGDRARQRTSGQDAGEAGELAELARCRQQGRAAVARNRETFVDLVVRAREAAERRDYEMAAVNARIAAFFAQWRHPGVFVSPDLERLLLGIGLDALPAPRPRAASRRSCARVLHVAGNVSILGGIPRMIRRWIQRDGARVHSLALTRQAPDRVPGVLDRAVHDTGGRVHDLRGTLIERAAELRQIAETADVVALHTFDHDVVPIMALAPDASPPTMFVNHSDHGFWLGASVSHVVANLRESGRALSHSRRGIAAARNLVVPTIIDVPSRTQSREQAKRTLGVDPNQVLLISIARSAKYRTFGGINFAEHHVGLLQQHANAVLMVVGPGGEHDWQAAIAATNGRIRMVPATEATALYFEAADIYVDSFPWVSTTSLLEAGSYGLPLVSREVFATGECGVLAADMPGLGPMLKTRTANSYVAALAHLIADEHARLALGERTRASIVAAHTGMGWQRAVEAAYGRALGCGPNRCLDPHVAPACGEQPDVFLPLVLGKEVEVDTIIEDHLGMMPLGRRLATWNELGRARHLRRSFAQLLPDIWYRRYQKWR